MSNNANYIWQPDLGLEHPISVILSLKICRGSRIRFFSSGRRPGEELNFQHIQCPQITNFTQHSDRQLLLLHQKNTFQRKGDYKASGFLCFLEDTLRVNLIIIISVMAITTAIIAAITRDIITFLLIWVRSVIK